MTNAEVYKQVSISKNSNRFASLQNASDNLSSDRLESTDRSKVKYPDVTAQDTSGEPYYNMLKEHSQRTKQEERASSREQFVNEN